MIKGHENVLIFKVGSGQNAPRSRIYYSKLCRKIKRGGGVLKYHGYHQPRYNINALAAHTPSPVLFLNDVFTML